MKAIDSNENEDKRDNNHSHSHSHGQDSPVAAPALSHGLGGDTDAIVGLSDLALGLGERGIEWDSVGSVR